MFCHACGSEQNETDKFCGNCGVRFEKEDEVDEKPAKQLDSSSFSHSTQHQSSNKMDISDKSESEPPSPKYYQDEKMAKGDLTSNNTNEVKGTPHNYNQPSQSRYMKSQPRSYTPPQKKEKPRPEESGGLYYLFALLWPIGIIVYFTIYKDKPILASEMRDIMIFSAILSIALWSIGVFDFILGE